MPAALRCGIYGVHINGPGIGPIFLAQASFSPATGQWYHLAVTRGNQTFRIYVDGNIVSTEFNAASIPDSNAPLTLGQAEGLGWMNGCLDEVSLYNYALSDAELLAIFNAGSAGKCLPARPSLLMARGADNCVVISWPDPATGFVLQENADLQTANWTNVTALPNTVAGRKEVTVPDPTGHNFYRLYKP